MMKTMMRTRKTKNATVLMMTTTTPNNEMTVNNNDRMANNSDTMADNNNKLTTNHSSQWASSVGQNHLLHGLYWGFNSLMECTIDTHHRFNSYGSEYWQYIL